MNTNDYTYRILRLAFGALLCVLLVTGAGLAHLDYQRGECRIAAIKAGMTAKDVEQACRGK
mgnify:CR=1 FL=1